MIAALAKNRVIGRDNQLPWQLPDDLKYFREKTRGHPVIMGRKCFESIGFVLPNRKNIVITRDTDWTHEGVTIVHSKEDALLEADVQKAAFVIGGGEIYRMFLPDCSRLYLTEVNADIDGEITFPELDKNWQESARHHHAADERHKYAFDFVVYERS